jgi:hypothetical protein
MQKLVTFLKKNFWLAVIIAIYLFSRLYLINSIPKSLYWDEASIGYNAYSVLKTGKDEWGESLPLHFRAFGEFKLPVYIYSVAVSELILGLNVLAVRLPAVIFGLGAVLGLYALALKISKDKTIAILSAFTFTISPWFFIFSRTGYEATAGLALFIWAIYFLVLSFKKSWLLLISTLFFVASYYSYNSFRVLAPVFIVPGLIFWIINSLKKKNIKSFVFLAVSLVIFLGSLVPIYKLYREDSGLGRLTTIGVESRGMAFAIGQNYIKHFDSKFLFVQGDTNPRSQIPGSPQLYWIDGLLILLGLVYILVKRGGYGYSLLLLALLIAPIPASITKESPHALRSILMAPIFSLVTASGIGLLIDWAKKYKNIVIGVVVVIYLVLGALYFNKFLTQYNKLSSLSWQYPYSQIFEKYSSDFGKYKTIYITDEYAQPYIFALFYNQINPNTFITEKVLNPVSDWGFSTVGEFGEFKFIKKCAADFASGSLIFCKKEDKPVGAVTIIGEILDLSGQSALVIYQHE